MNATEKKYARERIENLFREAGDSLGDKLNAETIDPYRERELCYAFNKGLLRLKSNDEIKGALNNTTNNNNTGLFMIFHTEDVEKDNERLREKYYSERDELRKLKTQALDELFLGEKPLEVLQKVTESIAELLGKVA